MVLAVQHFTTVCYFLMGRLRASMPKQNVGRLPRAALVHLQDYHVDETVIATFTATKQKEGCCSTWCIFGRTEAGDGNTQSRDFTTELDALAAPHRSFAYSIQAQDKRVGACGLLGLFVTGRFYSVSAAVACSDTGPSK